ncbi:MAG: mannose-1-phosphate guanylyltransferase, partial [Gallionella sp.]
DNPVHYPNGDFLLLNDRIVERNDLPLASCGLQQTFSGIGIYRPALFAGIPRGGIAPLAPLLRAQIALGKVSGERHAGLWVDVGTPQRLAELDRQVATLQNAP